MNEEIETGKREVMPVKVKLVEVDGSVEQWACVKTEEGEAKGGEWRAMVLVEGQREDDRIKDGIRVEGVEPSWEGRVEEVKKCGHG